jgi:hypothetical protein
MTSIHLDPASVEAIACRVAALLREDGAGGASDTVLTGAGGADELLTAAEVARRFGVSRDHVYRHAADLGAIRIGDGPRGRLRFDAATVAERLTACEGSKRSVPPTPASQADSRPKRRRRSARGPDRAPDKPALIPIRPPRRKVAS